MLPALPQEVVRMRYDDRGDPWWHKDRSSLRNVLRLPARLYKQLFHYSRPDTKHKVIRAPEWSHLHSEWRYLHSLFVYLGRPTRIIWKVKLPLLINMAVAGALIVAEELRYSHDIPALGVPEFAHDAVIQMFQLTSFVNALLLALRLNRTYERWWDAWRSFRRLGDCAAALTQQATIWCTSDPALQADVARWSVVWCYAVMQFVTGAAAIDPMAHRLLSEQEARVYDAAPNKFNFTELKLRKLVYKMRLTADQALSVDAHLREGWQCIRTCSTIKQTALPYALTLMCTGFLEIALVLLPIGFIGGPYHDMSLNMTVRGRVMGAAALLGLYMVTNLLLLGADEVACQLEDPFMVLPLQDRTEGVVDLIRRTFDESDDLDDIEAATAAARRASSLANGGPASAAWDDARSEALRHLDDIILRVQPLHRSDSITRQDSLKSAHHSALATGGCSHSQQGHRVSVHAQPQLHVHVGAPMGAPTGQPGSFSAYRGSQADGGQLLAGHATIPEQHQVGSESPNAASSCYECSYSSSLSLPPHRPQTFTGAAEARDAI